MYTYTITTALPCPAPQQLLLYYCYCPPETNEVVSERDWRHLKQQRCVQNRID